MTNPLDDIQAKCEQYWNEPGPFPAEEVRAILEYIHRTAARAKLPPLDWSKWPEYKVLGAVIRAIHDPNRKHLVSKINRQLRLVGSRFRITTAGGLWEVEVVQPVGIVEDEAVDRMYKGYPNHDPMQAGEDDGDQR